MSGLAQDSDPLPEAIDRIRSGILPPAFLPCVLI